MARIKMEIETTLEYATVTEVIYSDKTIKHFISTATAETTHEGPFQHTNPAQLHLRFAALGDLSTSMAAAIQADADGHLVDWWDDGYPMDWSEAQVKRAKRMGIAPVVNPKSGFV